MHIFQCTTGNLMHKFLCNTLTVLDLYGDMRLSRNNDLESEHIKYSRLQSCNGTHFLYPDIREEK